MRDLSTITLSCALILAIIGCGGGSSTPPPPPTPPPPAISTSPSSATVPLNGKQAFTATGSGGTAVAVNWSVNGVGGGNSAVGTIDQNGSYTAPANLPSPNTVTVTATLQSDSSKTGSSMVTDVFPSDNSHMQAVPVKLGTSGGNVSDSVTNGSTVTCCSGTLGALVQRNGTAFVLSNNLDLARSDHGYAGAPLHQPRL